MYFHDASAQIFARNNILSTIRKHLKSSVIPALIVSIAPATALAQEKNTPYVRLATPGNRAEFQTPEFKANWGLAMHGFDAAYAAGATGQGVTLGQLDTPLYAKHPEMAGMSLNTFKGWNEALNGQYEDKEVGWHGQHVAGLAVARKDGKGMHGGAYGSSIYFNSDYRSKMKGSADDYANSEASFINHSYGPDLPDYRKEIYKDGKLVGLAASNLSDLHLKKSLDFVTQSSLLGVVNVTAAGNDRLYAATKRALNKYDARPRLFRGISVGAGMSSLAAGMVKPRNPWDFSFDTREEWLAKNPNYKVFEPRDWPKLEKNIAVAVMLNGTSEISSYSALCGISKYSCVGTAGGMLAEPHQDYRVQLPDMPLDAEYYYPGPDGIEYLNKKLEGEIWASQYRMLSLATTTDAPAGASEKEALAKLRPIYKMALGTSMASPMLMAGLGVTKSRFPYMENWQVRDTVYTTARDIGAKGIDRVYGWGEMDLAAAMGGPRKLFALKRDYIAKLKGIEIKQANIYDQIVATADNFATEAYELKVQMIEKGIAADAAEKIGQDQTATQQARNEAIAKAKQLRTEIADLTPKEAAARKRAYELEVTRNQPNLPEDTEEEAFESILWNVNLPGKKSDKCNSDACIADAWTNDIDGPGGLNKQGAGALALAGTNTYKGGTTISEGVLQLGIGTEKGSVTGNIVNNGTLAYARNNEWVYGDVISGTGKVELFSGGTLRLTGANTYTGGSSIYNGKLAVDGSTVSVTTLYDGGTLGGNGAVGGIIANAGGVVAPGNSIGALTSNGDATFNKDSILHIEVNDHAADKLVVNGTTNLLGGVLLITKENSQAALTPGEILALLEKSFTIISSTGKVNGKFEQAASNYRFIGSSLDYISSNIKLAFERNNTAFADAGVTRNQKAVGSAVEQLGRGKTLYDTIATSTLTDDLAGTYQSLTGEIHATLDGVLIEDGHYISQAATDRLRAAFDGVAVAPQATVNPLAYGPADKPAGSEAFATIAPADLAPALWAQAYGAWAHGDSDGNASGYSRDTGGFVTGLDGVIAESWRFGLLASYGNSSLHSGGAKADIDSYQLGVYAGTQWDALGLRLGATLGHHAIDTDRDVVLGGVTNGQNASYSAKTVQAFGELGYKINTQYAALEPFAAARYTHLKSGSFQEDGADGALTGLSGSSDVTTTTLGLRLSRDFALSETTVLTARGMLGWNHAFGDVTPERQLAFAGGAPFSIEGLPIAKDAFAVEAGFDVGIGKRTTLGLAYTGQFSGDTRDNAVKADLTVKF